MTLVIYAEDIIIAVWTVEYSLRKVERAVKNMANLYCWWNQAPTDKSVRYMQVVDGRKAVLEMNIPALKTKRAKHNLPTFAPNSHNTPR